MNRRSFFKTAALGSAGALAPSPRLLAAAPGAKAALGSVKITDVKTAAIDIGYKTHLVKVTTDAGLYGLGEAYPKAEVGDDIHSVKNMVIGQDPLHVEYLHHRMVDQYMSRGARAGGLCGAIGGIETALWDLAGKILGVPVYVLLGGAYRDRVMLYNDTEKPKADEPKAWADVAVRSRDFGYRAVKHSLQRLDGPKNSTITLKTARHWTRILEETRAALGPEFPIGIDLHWRYALGDVLRFTEMIKDLNIWFLEDPLQPENADAFARLRAECRVPILTGENLYAREGFRPFIEKQACDLVHPDPQKCGGLLEAKRIADWADLYSMPMLCHNGATPVGTVASAHACTAIKSFVALEVDTLEGDRTPHWRHLIQWDGRFQQDGHLVLSQRPGLGIELDETVCRRHLADQRGFFQ
jgi:L-alanine-DL-glutamate epimerase-like enolase superfamily enzyme